MGKLQAIIYDFEEVGDILPMHTHGDDDNHITMINQGSFKVITNAYETVLKAGQIADWNAGEPHEFIALEPNSRFVNIIKGAA